MKNPLKVVKKISKIMAWLSLIFRILLAIKNVLNGNQNAGDDIADNHRSAPDGKS